MGSRLGRQIVGTAVCFDARHSSPSLHRRHGLAIRLRPWSFSYLSQPERKHLCVDGFAPPNGMGAQCPLWKDLNRLK